MKNNAKSDLRFRKNESLIRTVFKEMLSEMDYAKITVCALADRAQINRKTFYLHYASLDHLLAVLQLEIMEPSFALMEHSKFPDDLEKLVRHSFLFLLNASELEKKILSAKGNFPEGMSPEDYAREKFYKVCGRLPGCTPAESRIVVAFFSSCFWGISMQWLLDGHAVPLEDMVALTVSLISSGLHGLPAFRNALPNRTAP